MFPLSSFSHNIYLFSKIMVINYLKHDPQQIKTEGYDNSGDSLSGQSGAAMRGDKPIRTATLWRVGCIHCGIFSLRCWVTGRENRYSTEKPILVTGSGVLYFSSFPTLLRPRSDIRTFSFWRDWNVTFSLHGGAQGVIPDAAQASVDR